MNAFSKTSGADRPADPVSRFDLDRLKAQRARPEPAPALTPDGAQAVNTRENERQERQIGRIEAALQAQAGRASTGFALARVRDKARMAFERDR